MGRQRRHPAVDRSRQHLADDRHADQDGRQRERPLEGRAPGRRSQPDQHPLLRLAQGGPLEERRLGVDLGQGRRASPPRTTTRGSASRSSSSTRRAAARARRHRSSTRPSPTTTAASTAAPTPARPGSCCPSSPTGVMASHAEFDSIGDALHQLRQRPGPERRHRRRGLEVRPQEGEVHRHHAAAPKGDDKFGYGGLSVDAKHPGTLLVSTIDRWTKGDEVFRTTDGGKTWKPLLRQGRPRRRWAPSTSTGTSPIRSAAAGWATSTSIRFNPERAMYVTGAGIWASDNIDATPTPTSRRTGSSSTGSRGDGHQGAGQPTRRTAAA